MLMALSYEFLIERAEQAAQEAACSVLEKVRERALRSETAWRRMANQMLEVARTRELAAQKRLAEGQWIGVPQ
jgi:ribonuclease D